MAAKRAAKSTQDGTQEVTALLEERAHPLHKDIDQVRKIILGVDPSIREAVKWNTASFLTTEFFAAVHLRSEDRVQLVFHTGAKVKPSAKHGVELDDPEGLCRWLAKDRCLVTLESVKGQRKALEALVRQWIRQLA
ncbi:DUF1801 domain-containing protein [Myxococcus sp. K38C18041901]|uniref:DUF1801 domain-containing protein n=1 Tax=Myxococcus guangdongensis TaxID=2906760 RepID=UPI0020A7C7F2|nr:DUF1801 domain-containing protein [Myxococcus guangdongensis]MCP3060100.1 DUF1801 domain-containing protein [Myxococcus guangdongensis]